MCLAKVYQDIESDEPVVEDLAFIIINGNRMEMETLSGDRKVILGKVCEVDFVKSRVVIEELV